MNFYYPENYIKTTRREVIVLFISLKNRRITNKLENPSKLEIAGSNKTSNFNK
jgi:hypothetical protein